MSRVHTNIAHIPNRRLPQIFGAGPDFDAVPTADPNTLNSNLPRLADAMGYAGQDGVVSFTHDYISSDPEFSLWFWCDITNNFDPALGWILANEDTSGNTKTVPAGTLCSFTVPEGAAIYLQSSTAGVRNCWMGATRRHPANPNEDMHPSAANTA